MTKVFRKPMRRAIVAMALLGWPLGMPSAEAQVELHLFGKPYFSGAMTLSVTAPGSPGAPVLLAFGINPLPLATPVATSKGPFWIGTLINIAAVGATDASGRFMLPFVMPSAGAGLLGNAAVLQGYVLDAGLSNPALLRFDEPTFQSSDVTVIDNPNPTPQARFGDRVAVGDLNGDGLQDLVVGAFFENWLGIERSGRVYILWGPGFQSWTPLQSPQPKALGIFGCGLAVKDLDGDGIDDLVVGESTGDPAAPGQTGYLHVYYGGAAFLPQPTMSLPSLGDGVEYTLFGRVIVSGDFDHDGHPDLAAGVLNAAVGSIERVGRVDVYWGPDFLAVSSMSNPVVQAFEFFGGPMKVADVTGDGVDDLVVGVGRGDVAGLEDTGVVRVFSGSANRTFAQVLVLHNPFPAASVRFGEGVNAVDLDGDGRAEVIGSDVKNRFSIFWSPDYGAPTMHSKPLSGAEGLHGASSFGYFHSWGDVNGDQVTELLIADPFAGDLVSCGSLSKEGTVFLVPGPYYSTYHLIRSPLPNCADSFSWSAQIHDIESDGKVDLIVPAPTAEIGQIFNAGRCFIIHG